MDWQDFDDEQRFRQAWESVSIARSVPYGLFTFGETELPYYLVCGEPGSGTPVTITKGEVLVKRPTIITPESARPELQGFFEDAEEEGIAQFLLARAAHFSNLKLANQHGEKRIVSDSLDEAVERLNQQLDAEDEDRVAILTAPPQLGGIAVLRYATERVVESGPDNIQELRERGFFAVAGNVMYSDLRSYFDEQLEIVLAQQPEQIHRLLEEVPLYVEDYPSEKTMHEMGVRHRSQLCGLYTGIPITQRRIDHWGVLSDVIQIYREGILSLAHDRRGNIDEKELREQIRITVLHELGHHHGLDEDDLRELGYG